MRQRQVQLPSTVRRRRRRQRPRQALRGVCSTCAPSCAPPATTGTGYRPATVALCSSSGSLARWRSPGATGQIPLGGPSSVRRSRSCCSTRTASSRSTGSPISSTPAVPPSTAATQIHRQISELRKALGQEARLDTESPGYVLRLSPEQLDLKRFERLTAEAGRALARNEAETAFELQRDALAVWRGPPLAGLEDEPFAQLAIARLDEMLLAALEQRVDAELALGRHRELVAELYELAAEHPLHEPFAARLMLALYRSGRQADALDVYRRTRDRLVADFGIEPAGPPRARAGDPEPGSFPRARQRCRHSAGSARARLAVERRPARRTPRSRRAAGATSRPSVAHRAAAGRRGTAHLDRGRAERSARTLDVETQTAAFTTVDPVADAAALRRHTTSGSSCWTHRASTRTRSRAISPPSSSVHRPMSACSPVRPTGARATASASRSAATSTTGQRSSSGPGSRRAEGSRSVWWNEGRRPIRSTGREPPAGRRGDRGAACCRDRCAAGARRPRSGRARPGRSARDDP